MSGKNCGHLWRISGGAFKKTHLDIREIAINNPSKWALLNEGPNSRGPNFTPLVFGVEKKTVTYVFRPFYRGSYNTPYLFLRIGNRGPLGCGDVGPKNFGDLVLESLEPYTLEQVTSTKRGKYLTARWFKSWPFDPPIGGHFNPWKGHKSPSEKGHKGIARGIYLFTYWVLDLSCASLQEVAPF